MTDELFLQTLKSYKKSEVESRFFDAEREINFKKLISESETHLAKKQLSKARNKIIRALNLTNNFSEIEKIKSQKDKFLSAKKQKDRIRKHSIYFRLNDEEYELLKSTEKKYGMIPRELILFLLTKSNKQIQNFLKKKDKDEKFYELIKEIKSIGINVNQLAKKANVSNSCSQNDVQAMLSEQKKIWDYIKSSMKET